MNIHQLQGAKKEDDGEISVTHPDAFLLTQWLEQGVFHALEQEYLSALVFAIYAKQPVTNEDILLETYEFRATYQGDEKTAKINDVSLLSKESVKNQAAKFIRSLTEFAGTLDSLPDSCWITLQLKVKIYNFCSMRAYMMAKHSPHFGSTMTTHQRTTNRSTSAPRMVRSVPWQIACR